MEEVGEVYGVEVCGCVWRCGAGVVVVVAAEGGNDIDGLQASACSYLPSDTSLTLLDSRDGFLSFAESLDTFISLGFIIHSARVVDIMARFYCIQRFPTLCSLPTVLRSINSLLRRHNDS